MKKAVLSNRILLNYEKKLYEKCKEALTYKIPPKIPGDPPTTKRLISVIGEKFISLPIGRTDLIPEDYEIVDKRSVVPVKFPKFRFKLRESQQEIHDMVNDNCIINANVSWGKTFTGIAIAHKLGQKTLIITHTVLLRDQWVDEIEKTMGIKPGIIGGGVLDYKKHPIVVANIQTLRKYTTLLKAEFGTIILDEAHHCPATIFESTINDMRARYKIGLTATLRRKDYLHIIIPDYFGRTIYKPKKENQMTPEVYIIKTQIPFSSNAMIPWANKVNELVDRPEYLSLITETAEAFANKGHLVLVVSDRIKFLEDCHEKCKDRSVLVTSTTKDRDDKHAELERHEKDILFGSISIYKEGVSLNYISCLILAAPINNDPLLEQLIGRIVRKYENKLTPLIIDIVLKGNTARNQSKTRVAHYIRAGYKIHYLELP